MFQELIGAIRPLDDEAASICRQRIDNLTKPLNSLHHFEHIACRMAGITGRPLPTFSRKSIVVVTRNFESPDASAGLSIFAEHVGASLVTVDISTASQRDGESREFVINAVQAGARAAAAEAVKGSRIIGLGSRESCAGCVEKLMYCLEEMGTNISQDELVRILAKTDSFEIAGLMGVILGAAANRAAVVLDGAVSAAAALAAVIVAPLAKDYLIGSQNAVSCAHQKTLSLLGIPSYLHLGMNSEGGMGAVLGISLINAAIHILSDMKTFGEAGVAVAQDGPGALRQRTR